MKVIVICLQNGHTANSWDVGDQLLTYVLFSGLLVNLFFSIKIKFP